MILKTREMGNDFKEQALLQNVDLFICYNRVTTCEKYQSSIQI